MGLAIAHSLSQRTSSVLLLERHRRLGTETSSRNSEVVHAGLYYPAQSLKTRLCVRGRDMLYAFADRHGVPVRRTGKWIVAQDGRQTGELERLAAKVAGMREAGGLDVAVRWVGRREQQRGEADVFVDWDRGGSVLESPATGIVDSHGFMTALEGVLVESGGATVVTGAEVKSIEPVSTPAGAMPGDRGWELCVATSAPGSVGGVGAGAATTTATTIISASTIVNSAGLSSASLANSLLTRPPYSRPPIQMRFAKGNYFSYRHPAAASSPAPRVSRLIYPAPVPGAGGLGTHLTVDLAGRMRFGPDVEWVPSPDDLSVSSARLPQAAREIQRYLPGIKPEGLAPEYCGIRPKLVLSDHASRGAWGGVGDGKGFVDFVIRKEEGFAGWVNCLGIESPGLTSSLAVGEMVGELVYCS